MLLLSMMRAFFVILTVGAALLLRGDEILFLLPAYPFITAGLFLNELAESWLIRKFNPET